MIVKDTDFLARKNAQDKYRPENVEVLIIAEAPPADERYFYYEDVSSHDHLFINTIRAIYSEYEKVRTNEIREQKTMLLKRFKQDKFFVIDAVEQRIPSKTKELTRINLIRDNEKYLKERISKLNGNFICFIVKKSVYAGLSNEFKSSLVLPYNTYLPFPSNGHQKTYRDRLKMALRSEKFIGELKIA